jgi:hypothetical protein
MTASANLQPAQFGTNTSTPTGANTGQVSSNGQGGSTSPGSQTTTMITVKGSAPQLTTRSG